VTGKVGRLKNGMGNNIGMNVRRMEDVGIRLRIVNVAGYGICGVVSVDSTGPTQNG
jgi:hypothetical protein